MTISADCHPFAPTNTVAENLPVCCAVSVKSCPPTSTLKLPENAAYGALPDSPLSASFAVKVSESKKCGMFLPRTVTLYFTVLPFCSPLLPSIPGSLFSARTFAEASPTGPPSKAIDAWLVEFEFLHGLQILHVSHRQNRAVGDHDDGSRLPAHGSGDTGAAGVVESAQGAVVPVERGCRREIAAHRRFVDEPAFWQRIGHGDGFDTRQVLQAIELGILLVVGLVGVGRDNALLWLHAVAPHRPIGHPVPVYGSADLRSLRLRVVHEPVLVHAGIMWEPIFEMVRMRIQSDGVNQRLLAVFHTVDFQVANVSVFAIVLRKGVCKPEIAHVEFVRARVQIDGPCDIAGRVERTTRAFAHIRIVRLAHRQITVSGAFIGIVSAPRHRVRAVRVLLAVGFLRERQRILPLQVELVVLRRLAIGDGIVFEHASHTDLHIGIRHDLKFLARRPRVGGQRDGLDIAVLVPHLEADRDTGVAVVRVELVVGDGVEAVSANGLDGRGPMLPRPAARRARRRLCARPPT